MKKAMIWTSMLLILSGCHMADGFQDEQEVSENVYKAVMEGFSPDTKTELDANKILWSSGDRITVFDGNDTGKPYLLDPASAGSPSGEFTVTSGVSADGSGDDIDAVVAVYPHGSDLNLSKGQDGTLILGNVLFPSEQQYVPSSFARASFPMVSVTPEKELYFRNLGGIFRLKVRGSGIVEKVILEGNEGELISGNATVTLRQGTPPAVVMDADASGSISLICDPPMGLMEEETVDFYFSLPPVDFASGFTVTFECVDREPVVKRTIKSNKVNRSVVLSMPKFVLSYVPAPVVDLGLSVKWAAWNVGASRPEGYGDYFAWGETEPKTSYSKGNYVHYVSASGTYADLGGNISGTEHDVASVKWGDGWRMPTLEEMQELADLCVWSVETVEGVDGNMATGPNGNSIFIPNTGYCQGSSKYFDNNNLDGSFGFFWSATIGPVKNEEAYIINCEMGHGVVAYRYWNRYFGLPVRPVKD